MSNILAQPVTYPRSGKVAPNRFLKSAMTERLCTFDQDNLNERGKPTAQYIKLYEEWGKGEIGTIILGNIPCDRRYLEAKKNPVLDPLNTWNAVEAFKPVIKAAKAQGSLVVAQVTHAGRQTSTDVIETPVSSSDVQCPPMGGMTFGKPRPMTVEEIKELPGRFAFAAKALYDAGADGIQLHAAHGYLLSQFLSPRANLRTDDYGGSFENRSRIVFEIFDAIKATVPKDFILAIKINSADFAEGGFSSEECQMMTVLLEAAGVDLIELSGGTYESNGFTHRKESTKKREAFFIEFAELFRPHLKTAKLAVTGGFRSVAGMTEAITSNACDIIGIARPLCAEPYLCKEILAGEKIAAQPNYIPEAIQVIPCVMQLANISLGEPLLDTSNKEIAQKVTESILGSAKSMA